MQSAAVCLGQILSAFVSFEFDVNQTKEFSMEKNFAPIQRLRISQNQAQFACARQHICLLFFYVSWALAQP